MHETLAQIRSCRVCERHLPFAPKPIVRAAASARLVIVGQAPGRRVHESGIPWDDASGERLRAWLGIDGEAFYDAARVAIVPCGFCYPGKGVSGDLPPRPECAPLWHARLRALMPKVQLTLLIGAYAQAHNLGARRKHSVAETVRACAQYLPEYLPLPHPSPRNTAWLQRHAWFETQTLPLLRERVAKLLGTRRRAAPREQILP